MVSLIYKSICEALVLPRALFTLKVSLTLAFILDFAEIYDVGAANCACFEASKLLISIFDLRRPDGFCLSTVDSLLFTLFKEDVILHGSDTYFVVWGIGLCA